jgi:hypothetical protein
LLFVTFSIGSRECDVAFQVYLTLVKLLFLK